MTLSVWLTRDMRTVQLCTQREREGRELIDSASWDKDGAPGRLEAPSRPRPQGRALKAVPSRPRPQGRALKAAPSRPRPQGRALKAAPQLATPAWPGQTTKNGAALPASGWRSALLRSDRAAQGPMRGPMRGRSTAAGQPSQPVADSETRNT